MSTKIPLYELVACQIQKQIDENIYLPVDRLPSIRRMSRQMKVSVGTVQQAYAGLEDQDMIVPRQGAGYYVKARADVPPPEAAARRVSGACWRLSRSKGIARRLATVPASPIDFTDAADLRPYRQTLYVEDNLVTDGHIQVFGNVGFD